MATKQSKEKPKGKSQPVAQKQAEVKKEATGPVVMGYLPNDVPPIGQIILLGFQHALTMFPATVLVALPATLVMMTV